MTELRQACTTCRIACTRHARVAHGLVSAARVVVWQVVSACYRLSLAAETGVLRGHIVRQNLTFAARKGTIAAER